MDRILNMFELTEEKFLKNCAHWVELEKNMLKTKQR